MKVVFLEDVVGTARIGDIKEVKAGFARNYLLPRRLAAAATPAIVKSSQQRAIRETRLQDARDSDARGIAERLEAKTFSITARSGATGKLFGSVGTADIAAKVAEALKQEFDRHNVQLSDPIKDLGDYQVPVKLTKNITATLSISIVGEDGTTAADIRAKTKGAQPPAAATTGDEDGADEGESGADEDEETEDGDA